MDHKENQLIMFYYNKIQKGSFDEKDIYTFLILVRPYAKKNQPVYEFSNFIAHREKDRGFISDYLKETKTKAALLSQPRKAPFKIIIKDVFTKEQITRSFNDILSELNLSLFSAQTISGITLCVISLFQHIRIFEKNTDIGELIFAISNNEIVLKGKVEIQDKDRKGTGKVFMVFPVLTIQNNFYEIEDHDDLGTPKLLIDENSVVEIVNILGKLTITVVN
jgi:hypothetical protein